MFAKENNVAECSMSRRLKKQPSVVNWLNYCTEQRGQWRRRIGKKGTCFEGRIHRHCLRNALLKRNLGRLEGGSLCSGINRRIQSWQCWSGDWGGRSHWESGGVGFPKQWWWREPTVQFSYRGDWWDARRGCSHATGFTAEWHHFDFENISSLSRD